MFVDRLYFPVTTLGPGNRVVVWTCGCTKHCPGCANPELWETRSDAAIAPARLAAMLNDLADRTGAHRITFTGGDPLEQADDLAHVLAAIRPAFDDILVYTGYTAEELESLPNIPRELLPLPFPQQKGSGHLPGKESASPSSRKRQTSAPLIDALIDGPYVEAENDGVCGLRGSTNQRVIVLNPALETLYHEQMQKPRSVQNAVFDGRALSIGIHGRPRETRKKE